MFYEEIVGKIRRKAPKLLEGEILLLINEGSDTFCEVSRIMPDGLWEFVADGNMYHDLDEFCSAVDEVDVGGLKAEKYGGNTKLIELQG